MKKERKKVSMEEASGFCTRTGTYHSQWDTEHHSWSSSSVSLPNHLLSNLASPSKPAFVDAKSDATLTFRDLLFLSSAIARSLMASGVAKGDVVLLVSPNFLYFPAFVLGIMATGAVFSTCNFLNTRSELREQILDSNPVLIICTNDLRSKLDGLTSNPLLLVETLLVVVSGGINRIFDELPEVEISPSDTAALMYSSGTTGKSKAVVCSHGNMIAMSQMLRVAWSCCYGDGDNNNTTIVDLCVLPLFHMFGLSVFICGAVSSGSTVRVVVATGRYSTDGMLTAVEKHRVTRIMVVPPMIVKMVTSFYTFRKYQLGSLKEVVCSGAQLGTEHMGSFAKCFPNVRLSQLYGLTESVGPIVMCDGVKNGEINDSVGRLGPSVTARIIDVRSGKSVAPNCQGELCVKGPSITKGYLNNKEATSSSIDSQGWLHTGDLCYIDGKGLVYVVDRIKELIKYKAYQVPPAELEEILSAHPEIIDTAVLPYPNDEVGEIPMACVVKRAGSGLTEDEIICFVQNKVTPYKKIRKVVFVDFIPRSTTGKILRRRLKEKNNIYPTHFQISSKL